MGTNFESCFHLCQLTQPLLKAFGYGSIVLISGLKAFPLCSTYATTKGALNQFTKMELAKDNIRANTVAPGPIKTLLLEYLIKSTAEVHKMVVAMESQMTVGRLGEPKDISTPIAFLCLPAACDASYITS
ncbi:hypothetical protein AAZV13_18G139800 [Glycine max]|eukprot:XP_014626159.1 tropinone reductase homolog At5g06060 [Glycine max]